MSSISVLSAIIMYIKSWILNTNIKNYTCIEDLECILTINSKVRPRFSGPLMSGFPDYPDQFLQKINTYLYARFQFNRGIMTVKKLSKFNFINVFLINISWSRNLHTAARSKTATTTMETTYYATMWFWQCRKIFWHQK